MGLWDTPKPLSDEARAKLDEMARKIKALSSEEFKRRREEDLKVNCEHGTPRTKKCCWCYVQTPEYRESLARTIRTTVLD